MNLWSTPSGAHQGDVGLFRPIACRSRCLASRWCYAENGFRGRKGEPLPVLAFRLPHQGTLRICAALDEKVRKFREGPLGEIRYVWVDALYEKVRVDDRVESMAVVIATGANLQGRREVLGFDVIAAESEDGWAEFFKGLKERGLHGVKLVISDAHTGLKNSVRKVLKAEWQRCKVHFYRNVLVHVPKRSQGEVSEAMKAVFVHRDEKSAKTKADDLVRQFQSRFAKAMEIFEAGIDDVLATCTIRSRIGCESVRTIHWSG
jgi:transposase-like protein